MLARTCYDTITSTYEVKAQEDRGVYYERGKGDFVLPPFASALSDLNRVVLSFDIRSEFVTFAFDGETSRVRRFSSDGTLIFEYRDTYRCAKKKGRTCRPIGTQRRKRDFFNFDRSDDPIKNARRARVPANKILARVYVT